MCDGFAYLIPYGLPEICIRTVYLFYEKRDCLNVLSDAKSVKFRDAALATFGFLASPEGIIRISLVFPNARFVTVFGDDLPAIVLTCKISLWLKGFDATFLVLSHHVIFTFKSCEFSCAESLFSLNRFCKITGFRAIVRPLQIRQNPVQ